MMQTCRLLGIAMAAVLSAAAQAPPDDIRNTHTPNGKTHFRMTEVGTLAEWQQRRATLRRQILAAAGLLPMPPRTPLRSEIFGRIDRGDHTIEKVLIQPMPGFYLAGNLYRPASRRGRLPGILSPHGHWKHGRLENTDEVSVPGRCISLARQGYVVFSYDMVGYNDTRQLPHKFGGRTEQLWSFTPLGLQLWNSIRALDFLQSLPDVDERRIGVTGASGGGTQTFLLAAVDPRVKAAAPVNMVSATFQGGCECENAPGLRVGTFNAEIAALIAPRPLLLVSATGDWTANVPREEFPAIRKVYELFQRPQEVESVQFNAGHNYNRASREAVYRFFARHLLHDPGAAMAPERDFEVPPESQMRVLNGKKLPEGALDEAGVFARWKELTYTPRRPAEIRFVLSAYLGSEWPQKLWADQNGERIVLSRVGRQDRVPGMWFPGRGRGKMTLVVHPEGSAAARKAPGVEKMIVSGQAVLLIDAFQTGAAKAARDRSDKYFHTFNVSTAAARVQDILTALRFLQLHGKGRPIELAGINSAAVWCVFAAAVAPVRVQVYGDLGTFRGSDEDFLEHFFVPGVQRAGGLDAALRVAAPSPLPWQGQ